MLHSFIGSFVHLFIRSFIHLFIQSFIHLLQAIFGVEDRKDNLPIQEDREDEPAMVITPPPPEESEGSSEGKTPSPLSPGAPEEAARPQTLSVGGSQVGNILASQPPHPPPETPSPGTPGAPEEAARPQTRSVGGSQGWGKS